MSYKIAYIWPFVIYKNNNFICSNLIIIEEKILKNISQLITAVISGKGNGIRYWCSREHFDYLNYLNLYNVNYICISYIIKTKAKFAFNNEGKKEYRQAGKHRAYWRSRKIEKEGKRIILKNRNIKGERDDPRKL